MRRRRRRTKTALELARLLVALDDAQRERRPFFRPRTRLSLSAGR